MRQVVNDDDTVASYDKAETIEDDTATCQLLQQAPNDPLSNPEKKCVQPGGLKIIIIGLIIFALAVTVALIIDIYTGEHNVGHGAVASDAHECSKVGEDILKKGGNAVDAAIATTLCVGVICLESSGIGGGGFMLIQSPEGEVKVIDFREVAPSAANKTMFTKDKESAQTGGLAVAVPGQILGLEWAHQKYGKLKWSELFSPAIKIAQDGFEMHPTTRKYLDNKSIYNNLSQEIKDLLKDGGSVKRPLLAETLERISSGGSKAFYHGDIAKSIVDMVKKHNGIMTMADLGNYTPIVREALTSDYHDYRIFTAPPPTSGLVLLSALNILEGFNLTKANRSDPMVYHYLVETMKFVFAQRSRLADPKFVDVKNITKAMLSKKQAEKLRKLIDKNKTYTNASHYGPFFGSPPNKGTSHVTVMDRRGGVVSITSSNNGPFGSKLYTSTGIVLNNDMDDFSTPGLVNFFGVEPSPANFIQPGKRALSSIAPVIALRKSNLCGNQIALGAAGGTRITSAVLQVLLNILSYDRNLTTAIDWPRLHHQLNPMLLEAEGKRFRNKGISNIIDFLEAKGNKVDSSPTYRSIVNGVVKQDGHIYGYADRRRKDGGAAVY